MIRGAYVSLGHILLYVGVWAAKGGIDALRHCYLNDGTGADEDAPLLSLARKCWPGPLTLVLPRGDSIPDCVVRTGWGCHYGFYLHLEVRASSNR